MENRNYMFRIHSYEIEKLLPQVSKALEKRMELVSRQRYPGMWKYTDKLNSTAHGPMKSKARTKIMSVIYLVLGIFLFLPGLMEPQELLIPLLVGAIAIGAGIGGLWRSRDHRKNPFDNSAKILLTGKDTISAEQELTVSFSQDGMEIAAKGTAPAFTPYADFECVIETADIFLFVYKEQVTVLQKLDLEAGSLEDFCSLLSENITKYQAIL